LNETLQKALAFLVIGVYLMFLTYTITYHFGVAPQALTDVGMWLSDNTLLLTIAFCFLAFCYMLIKIKRRNDYSPSG
jgi:hypothetical protein